MPARGWIRMDAAMTIQSPEQNQTRELFYRIFERVRLEWGKGLDEKEQPDQRRTDPASGKRSAENESETHSIERG
mgnify:CR=1 FL=1